MILNEKYKVVKTNKKGSWSLFRCCKCKEQFIGYESFLIFTNTDTLKKLAYHERCDPREDVSDI